jgi:hypothetical protein
MAKVARPPLKSETDAGYFGRLPAMPYAHMFEQDDKQSGGRDQCRARRAIMIKRTCGPIYARVIASLIPAVVLALMADGALAAEMPEDFQGTWCTSSDTLKDDWGAYNTDEGADCEGNYSSVEITATGVKSPALSVSCIVRKVTQFDVCPWGMIFRSRERARALRAFQINPWSPGYHIVLQCTSGSKQSETIGADWVIEKGSIRVGIPRDYRCPWDRRSAR